MSQDHHTPIPFHSARTTAILNAPLAQLDAAISVNGTGDDVLFYNQDGNAGGQNLTISRGTTGSPDTVARPVVKINRVSDVPESAWGVSGSDGAPELAALFVGHESPAGGTNQPVAILGVGRSYGESAGSGGRRPDATGGYFVGWVDGEGIGGGIGSFHAGVCKSPNGKATGMEIFIQNETGDDHMTDSGGAGMSTGIWMNAYGGRVANGVTLGAGFGYQFDSGFHACAGSIYAATFRDDSDAIASIDINGSHVLGLDLAGGTYAAGAIALGNGSTQGILGLNAASNAYHRLLDYDSSNNLQLGAGIAGNLYSAKLHIFGAGINLTAQNIGTDTSTGTSFGTSTSEKVGMHGSKTAQQTVSGSRGGNAALASLLTALAAKGIVVDGTSA